MNCVIVGVKERNQDDDKVLVEQLLDQVYRIYPACMVVTAMAHAGVGSFCKAWCLKQKVNGTFRRPMTAIEFHLFASNLGRLEYSAICTALNAYLFEIGDMFCYFTNAERKGMFEDLMVNRVIPAGRPYKIYMPGDEISLPCLD